MADAVWYFADGDVQRGPITEAQLRALIGTGNLTPEDQVWKEGMEDWTPAGEVPGLFNPVTSATPPATPVLLGTSDGKTKATKAAKSTSPPAASAMEAKPRRPRMRFDVQRPVEIFRFAAFLGQPLLLVSLLLVLLPRGCDRLGERHVARVQAQAKLAENEFQDQWERQKMPVEQELNDLQAKADPSAEERSRRDLLTEQLDTLNKRKLAEQQSLRAGQLRELTATARDAEALQALDNFWREGIFRLGVCLLSLSLLIVGFSGAGPERWMAWVLLAVILFGLFSGSWL